jgi:hypothetical protein
MVIVSAISAIGAIARAVAAANVAKASFFIFPPGVALAGFCPAYTLCRAPVKGYCWVQRFAFRISHNLRGLQQTSHRESCRITLGARAPFLVEKIRENGIINALRGANESPSHSPGVCPLLCKQRAKSTSIVFNGLQNMLRKVRNLLHINFPKIFPFWGID